MRPIIRYAGLICLSLAALTPAFAQTAPVQAPLRQIFRINSGMAVAQREALSPLLTGGQLLTVETAAVQEIIDQRRPFLRVEIPFETGRQVAELQRFEILKPGARTVAGRPDGDIPVDIRHNFIAYQGKIAGEEASLVVMTFSGSGVIGVIQRDVVQYNLGSLRHNRAFAPTDYILYAAHQLKINSDFFCESELFEIPPEIEQLLRQPALPAHRSGDMLEVEVAVESDYQTFTRFGSVERATEYLLSLMATVSAVYIRDLNVKLLVSFSRVWSDPNDPYSDNVESSSELLDEFRNYWRTNMNLVTRDLAHFISTRSGGLGGVAWLNVLCQSTAIGNGYAFSNTGGSIAPLPVYTWDVDVVAHETGHNFGSPHTHSCSWNPRIDTCVVNEENNNCSDQARPRTGTIMSYCHLTNRGKTLDFHPQPIALMRNRAEQANCLSVSDKQLELLFPNGGEQYLMDTSADIIWGTGIAETVDLFFSVDSGATWEPIALGVPAGARQYEWRTPIMHTTRTALVRIAASDNPALADTSDAVFTIRAVLRSFQMISPAQFSTTLVSPEDPTPVEFRWHSAGRLDGITYRGAFEELRPNPRRFFFVANQLGQDTTATLTAGVIDSMLTSWEAWTADSVRVRWVTYAYLEGDSIKASNLRLIWFKRLVTGIEPVEKAGLPQQFALMQNYPNPFNPSTQIEFALPAAGKVHIKIYDVRGSEVVTLVDYFRPGGFYEVTWEGKGAGGGGVPSGIYFYRMAAETVSGQRFGQVRKMMLIR